MIEEEELTGEPAEELRRLLLETQGLSAGKAICEVDIAEQVAQYRAGR